MKDFSPTVPFKKLKNTKAWKITSYYVRKKAKNICYTCGHRYDFKELSAGHFIEKIGAAGIYFDLRGLRAQCFYCNRRLHGNKAIYAKYLVDEYGPGILNDLHKAAQKPKHWTKNELEIVEKAVISKMKLEHIPCPDWISTTSSTNTSRRPAKRTTTTTATEK